jgi:hypothetical protein
MTDTKNADTTTAATSRPLAHPDTPDQPEQREAHDAGHTPALQRDPTDADAKLDIELDESFPSSDPPSTTQPGRGLEPAPSSGFTPGE